MAKKEMEQEEMEASHADMRVYELGFHLDPELASEEAKKAYQALRGVIESVGTLVAEGEPEKIQLAYTVSRTESGTRRDFDASYFAWIAYETDGAGHEKVAEAAREAQHVFRFLDIRTDKESAKHSAEMYELMAKAPAAEGAEEVSDTELDAALKEVA